MSIWYFNSHKYKLCYHGYMQQFGVNYWYTYSLVVNWMSSRTVLALIILRNIHTNYVDFFLAYTQVDVRS